MSIPAPTGLPSRRPHRQGRILVKALLLAASLGAALLAGYHLVRTRQDNRICIDHLKKLYGALELYELDRGALPALAFYPGDDLKQEHSNLRLVLEAYGAEANTCLCPALPKAVNELGLSYVWNVKLNGQKIPRSSEATWMLIEISALSPEVPAPHGGFYNALYSDGSVRALRVPPPELREP
jgi:prepilin-type processing-associated H-X9-DG protein